MKRVISLILCALMILPCCIFPAMAAESQVLTGNMTLFCDSADKLVLANKTFYPAADAEVTVDMVVTDVSYTYHVVLLNGTKIGTVTEGKNTYTFNRSVLKNGSNEIQIVPSLSDKSYDESMVYGEYNIDDIFVQSVKLSGLDSIYPAKIKNYLPIVGSAGTTVTETAYTENVRVGDGWVQDTGFGGNIPQTPVCVGFIFEKSGDVAFDVNTSAIADGKYEAVFYKNNTVLEKRQYIIDNNAPVVKFSVANGSAVSQLDTVTFSVTDSTSVTTQLYVDGAETNVIDVKSLGQGSHTAYIVATDSIGHTTNEMLVFNVTDKRYSVSLNNTKASVSSVGEATLYSGTPLKNIKMYENPLGEYDTNLFSNTNEALVAFNNKADITTTALGNRVPYQSFVVDTSDAVGDTVTLSYSGETGTSTGILLKVWNYKKGSWDSVAKTDLDGYASVELSLATYSKDNQLKAVVTPDIVYNGSNTVFWNSDTQYYSRYEDLNELYYIVNNYAVDLYNKEQIAYCVHTGDLIDQSHGGDVIANTEFAVADKAQKILEDALVPHGVVSGNHDVMHSNSNYQYYWQYFGEDRYKGFDWYGGSLNNNMHHYDLVSIGSYDFVFLYIGTYREADADTIAWANAVCEAYPDRNVIVCTHQYINTAGVYVSDNSQVIWDEIVVPNENVVMVWCGHVAGVCDQFKQVGNSGRYVLEVLADYQYADLGEGGNGITHTGGGSTLDGEGFIRFMTFSDAGQVIAKTYSPAADLDNYYAPFKDSFVYDIDFVKANRSITTKSFDVLTDIEKVTTVNNATVDIAGKDAFYLKLSDGALSEAFVLNKYTSNYTAPSRREYRLSESKKVVSLGYSNVSENLHWNEIIPKSDLNATVGLDLMTGDVTLASGSPIYTAKVNSNNSVTVKHSLGSSNENWVTLKRSLPTGTTIDLSTYNRLYFAVNGGKGARWNLYVNFSDSSFNFLGSSDVLKLFGNTGDQADISGTWSGYIDLSTILTGTKTVTSIYLVSSSPEATVTFDYFFFGKSSNGKIRFVVDETTSYAKEAKAGTYIKMPAEPYKNGYVFQGWYTSKTGGKLINGDIYVNVGVTEYYARFAEEKQSSGSTANDPNYSKSVYKNIFWVTHFNKLYEGAGTIFTEAYTEGSWNLHIAMSPTNEVGIYEITAISNGTSDGSAKPLDIPQGGFVYVINRGNDWPSINADGSGINYTSNACDVALYNALKWKIGDKLAIGGLSVANKTVPTTTSDIEWYYDNYTCTATYELNPVTEGDSDGDGIADGLGATVDANGNYSFQNAYGYVFDIDDVDGAIGGEDATLITNAASYAQANPNWAVSVQLVPTGTANEYSVQKVVSNPGTADAAGMSFDNGKVVLIVHSAASRPKITNADGSVSTYPNWMDKVAALALKTGDVLVLSSDMVIAEVLDPTIDDDTSDSDESEDTSEDETVVYENDFWLTHYNDLTAEGAGVIVTDDSILTSKWNNYYAFAPVAGTDAYELVSISLGNTVGTAEFPAIPAGGFVYSLNEGNNYPELYAKDPVTYSWCQGLPNYTSDTCNNMIADALTWSVGDQFVFSGVDVANFAVPTSTPSVNWYDDAYACTATYEAYGEEDDSSTDVSDEVSEDPSEEPSEDPSEEPSEDPSDDPSEDPSEDPSDDPSIEPEPEIMRGDVDGNGDIDQYDYLLVKRAYFNTYALDEQQQKRADVDRSNEVDQMDYLYIKRHYFNTYVIG